MKRSLRGKTDHLRGVSPRSTILDPAHTSYDDVRRRRLPRARGASLGVIQIPIRSSLEPPKEAQRARGAGDDGLRLRLARIDVSCEHLRESEGRPSGSRRCSHTADPDPVSTAYRRQSDSFRTITRQFEAAQVRRRRDELPVLVELPALTRRDREVLLSAGDRAAQTESVREHLNTNEVPHRRHNTMWRIATVTHAVACPHAHDATPVTLSLGNPRLSCTSVASFA